MTQLSKLQSEAVLEFKSKYPKYRYLCRYSDDFKKGEWINIEDVFKFYNDQIQKAYSKGREEVFYDMKEGLVNFAYHNDEDMSDKLKNEYSIRDFGCFEKGWYLYKNMVNKLLLSIQSK